MNRTKKPLRINGMAVFLLAGSALVALLLLAAHGLTRYVEHQRQMLPYEPVDRFLQAQYVDTDAKALIDLLPAESVKFELASAHRDYDAWVQQVQDVLRGPEEWEPEEEYTYSWEWISTEVLDPDRLADVWTEYIESCRHIPSRFMSVKVKLSWGYGDDRAYAQDYEFIVARIDWKWYVEFSSAIEQFPSLAPDSGAANFAAVSFLHCAASMEKNPVMAEMYGTETPGHFVSQALDAELTAHGITYDQYREAILQRSRAYQDSNAAAGISYKISYNSSVGNGVYLKCEDELPALKKIYRERYGVDIVDAWTTTFDYTRTTPEGTTNHTLTLTTVKVGNWSYYIDLTSLPWAESGLFSFDGIG